MFSIHPRYAERLFDGTKRVEFRRRGLSRVVGTIVVYATAPTSAVVGMLEIGEIRCATPDALWREFGAVGGIERAAFDAYYRGVEKGVAYVVARATRFDAPRSLGCFGYPGRPPQAACYLRGVG